MKKFWYATLAVALIATGASAQTFLAKPIKFLAAHPPGGPVDIMARIVAARLAEPLGQPVLIENRPGAGGNIGTALVARSAPDGYTILVNSSAFAVNPSLYAKAGYDPFNDFVPVINAASSPNLIFVHPSLPVTTLAELIALSKTQKLSYASAGIGTTPHLTGELLLKTLAGIDITHIPFSGAGPAVNAVAGGQVLVGSTALPPAVTLMKAGRLRPIVVTSPQRSPVLPDVPTAAESGFPGYADYTWIAFFAPAGTPKQVVELLNREIAKVLVLPEVKEQLTVLGFDPQPNTPEQFSAYLKSEVTKWAKVVKDAGARVD